MHGVYPTAQSPVGAGATGCGVGSGAHLKSGVALSAAMYLFAAYAVEHGRVRIFNRDHGWRASNPT